MLFVSGNEVSADSSDRFLTVPWDESANNESRPSEEVSLGGKARAPLSIIAYPQEFKSWSTADYNGVEVYNVYTNAREINPLLMFFDSLWSYRSYPDLLFANFYSRPVANLQKWDQAMASKGRSLWGSPATIRMQTWALASRTLPARRCWEFSLIHTSEAFAWYGFMRSYRRISH